MKNLDIEVKSEEHNTFIELFNITVKKLQEKGYKVKIKKNSYSIELELV